MLNAERLRAGFTLLEALVALTILAGVTASVMTLIATNRRAQAHADADLSAALHVRTLLARVGRDLPLEVGTQSGTFEDGQTWSIFISSFKPDGGFENRQRSPLLQVHVRLQHGLLRQSLVDVFTLRKAAR
ncbi:PulJ/GspJ family protein [Microvirga sp. 2TAF3]|uniref:PulJ/GspJ family protein n=1 Tax=Microvirga sp. 2TAF3 TaxID=3233014 RepID=UPI003F9ABE58